MVINTSEICRLCLQINNDSSETNFKESDGNLTSIRNKLYLCLPELDVRVISKIMFCENCSRNLTYCYVFLNKFNAIEEPIKISENSHLSSCFSEINCVDVKMEIKEEESHFCYTPNNKNVQDMNGTNFIYDAKCNMCSQIIHKSQTSSLNYLNLDRDLASIYHKLHLCFPELDLYTTPKVVLCITCFEAINIVYSFKEKHNKIEIQLNKHLQNIYSSTYFDNSEETLKLLHTYFLDIKKEIKTEEIHINTKNLSSPTIYNLEETKYKIEKNEEESNKVQNWNVSTFHYKNENNFINQSTSVRIDKLFQCQQCKYNTKSKSNIEKHVLIHTGEKPYTCLQCNKLFRQTSHLNKHMYVHTGVKRFMCAQCDYASIDKASLKLHIRKHTGERPFVCSQCNCSFTKVNNLNRHKLTHLNQKPFKCGLCEYRAADKTSLKIHMFNHTGEKPYKCTSCSYCTNNKSTLKTHILMHSGKTPFKCPQCKYGARQKSKLKRHMSIHLNENRFSCSYCTFSTKFKTPLMKHMLCHKNKKLV